MTQYFCFFIFSSTLFPFDSFSILVELHHNKSLMNNSYFKYGTCTHSFFLPLWTIFSYFFMGGCRICHGRFRDDCSLHFLRPVVSLQLYRSAIVRVFSGNNKRARPNLLSNVPSLSF